MSTYTHHMVDDVTISADEAMDCFRKQFPLTGCNVYAEGNIMNYRLKVVRNAASYEKLARLIIKELNLPLEANLEEWKKGGVVFEVNLSIKYNSVC
jgi:hypothetical protein